MRYRGRHRCIKFITVFAIFTLVIFLLSDASSFESIYQTSETRPILGCEVIHIGIVCIGYNSNVHVYTLLKSVYSYRNNPLHFHIIVDDVSEVIVRTLFDTWTMPQVKISFYNTKTFVSDFWWVENIQDFPEIYEMLKFTFPKIISANTTKKIIVIDTDVVFNNDIFNLWIIFKKFSMAQVVGLVESRDNSDYVIPTVNQQWPKSSNNKRLNTRVILYHLEHLKAKNLDQLWFKSANETALHLAQVGTPDQDLIKSIFSKSLSSIYRITCNFCNGITRSMICYNNKIMAGITSFPKELNGTNNDAVIYRTFQDNDGNLLRERLYRCTKNSTTDITTVIPTNDNCFYFREVQTHQWRTLLFFREFKYNSTTDDVTFVSQLSYSRLNILKEVTQLWDGPMSIVIYVSDSELIESINFINNSTILQKRYNIAYHAVFKEGTNYPINMLRNVALRHAVTPYVFLVDIDFLPMPGLYLHLKNIISNTKDMTKKALIVPAFETKVLLPKTKIDLLKMLANKSLSAFHEHTYHRAHAPTNYTKWRTAYEPYQVMWKQNFEPYIIVQRNVTEYDKRFFGYGWNKVSHIMELNAQGYQFFVLPNAFIIHKAHKSSTDRITFLRSRQHKKCLQILKRDFSKELKQKYKQITKKNT